MNFYERQAAARRQTRWLLLGFVLAVAAVVFALDLVILTAIAGSDEYGVPRGPFAAAARHPTLALAVPALAAAVILLASLYKSLRLREGGGAVARALGGVRIDRDTRDLRRKRLHNVIEEMAIASGVPMPEVYVLEQEAGINAFAAGHTAANAAVAVTQGALDRLKREELQGVIAHEFSHVLNGDMRLNVRLLGWVFGLFVITLIGRTVLRGASRARKNGLPILLVALATMVIGYVGMLAGRVLQAAVSRQRERLADASAVQFTRNPDGLKGALLKIAGLGEGSKLRASAGEEVAHMLFAAGFSRMLATHPPIEERIRSLDPSFDARSLPRLATEALRAPIDEELRAQTSGAALSDLASSGVTTAATSATASAMAIPVEPPATVPAEPRAIAAQVGHPQTVHVRYARQLRLQLPEHLREFVESTGRARALVLGVLLSRVEPVRQRQLEAIAAALGATERAAVEEAAEIGARLAPFLRLPAVLQLFPALRRLPEADRESLGRLIATLADADARIEVFEYCLARLVATALRDLAEPRALHGQLKLDAVTGELGLLFSTLAQAGAADERQARRAYESGLQKLLPLRRPEYAPAADWPQRLDRALERLDRLHPIAKEALVEGLVCTISHDEQLHVAEAEMLRTVCAILHCPLPPLLGRLASEPSELGEKAAYRRVETRDIDEEGIVPLE